MAETRAFSSMRRERQKNADENYRVAFTGASYCGQGMIEQLDFGALVTVLFVGSEIKIYDDKYMKRIETLPMQVFSIGAIDEATLRTALGHSPDEDCEGVEVVRVCPAAVGALHLVDELVGSNYVVFNLEHSDVDSAIDRFCEHGRAAISNLHQRKKND